MKQTILIILASLCLSIFFLASSAWSSEPTEFVRAGGKYIPVRAEPKTLIVGIDPDKLVRRYLPDFDLFEKSIMMPSAHGLTVKWQPRVSQSVGESTDSVWPTRLDTRFVRLEFGVFPSHRAALIGASRIFFDMQLAPQLLPLSSDDPTYVAWTMSGSREGIPDMFVRDNVFVTAQIAEGLDPLTFVKRLDEDLRGGAEGVFKGEKVNPPVIIDRGFPSFFSLGAAEKAIAFLDAYDPDSRSFYSYMWIENTDIDFSAGFHRDWPSVRWEEPGRVEIEPHGGPVTVELRGVLVNDLHVVSDVWSKTVQISVAE